MLKRITSGAAYSAVVLAALLIAPFPAIAASPLHVTWEGLSIVVGKTVSVAMPGGAVVVGKAMRVEDDALVVDVKSTSEARAYPKGPLRVPRPTLRFLEMRTKGKAFRILGTVLGFCAGAVGGAVAGLGIQGGLFNNNHQNAAAVAFVGIWAGGTVAGYFVGNAADRRWTPVEIVP
ncbi:MAG: hypothetical protein LAQ30_13525 [Acidobacteriia bacterium]|nr:hypothetical protein [Terriglobia bacterium]